MLSFTSPTKTASVSQEKNGLYVGVVTKSEASGIFVEIPAVITDFSFGPAVVANLDYRPDTGDKVICGFLNNSLDELVILGESPAELTAAPAAPIEPWLTGSKSTSAVMLGERFDIKSDQSDYFGYAIALSSDGKRMAVGAINSDEGVTAGGKVETYEWTSSGWTAMAGPILGDAAPMQLGFSVAMSADGTTLAAGGNAYDSSRGIVRVYKYASGVWSQIGADLVGDATNSSFGISVSLSSDGTRLAVGASAHDNTYTDQGLARVFDWDGTSWTQIGSDIEGDAAYDNLGTQVSLSSDGSRLAVSAPSNNGGASAGGQIKIYDYSGGSWTIKGSEQYGYTSAERLGKLMRLSGDGQTIIAGPQPNSGTSVKIYRWSSIYDDWIELYAIDEINSSSAWGSGLGISADGNRIAIGAYSEDLYGSNTGAVRVYDWNGTKFVQVGGDFIGWSGDYFGNAVAMSGDGLVFASGTFADPFFVLPFAFV